MANDSDLTAEAELWANAASEDDVRKEFRSRDFSDASRYTHWVGLALLGTFLVGLINALPLLITDQAWQLNLISILMNGGGIALVGALLIRIARLFDFSDRQVQKRAELVRSLATWVAMGWLLLIPLQLFLGVRLINSQAGGELQQIQAFEDISRAVRNTNTEEELRTAMAQIPNQPPLPRLTVPLEVAKANLLAQFQKTINTAKNRQDEGSSSRWQNWMKEAFRNSLQCVMLSLGFLSLGKNRILDQGPSRGFRSLWQGAIPGMRSPWGGNMSRDIGSHSRR